MYKLVSLLKKKKEPIPWAYIDRCEAESDNRAARTSQSSSNNSSNKSSNSSNSKKNVNSNNSNASNTITNGGGNSNPNNSTGNHTKKSKDKNKQQHRISSDEDSDDLIPEEIRPISKVVDFSKSERKWLTSLNIPPEILESNLYVLINVLNFLSKKEGIYYVLNAQTINGGSTSSSRSNTITSPPLNLQTNNNSNNINNNSNNNNSTPSIGNSLPTSNSTGNLNKSTSSQTSTLSISTTITSTTSQPSPNQDGAFTQTRRRDYNRIFTEPGKYYSFPESESLAMARLITEEEDPSRLFKMSDTCEVSGAFGTVFQVYYNNGQYNNAEVALKKMDHKSERNRRNNLNEIAILRYLKHPNIVSYINSYEKNDEEIWMVMEYMDGGTIRDAITNFTFTEKYVAHVIKQVLHALEYLHSLNIAHRDLKSANIMINSKAEVKLIDFGFSIDFTHLKADTHMCGSPFWMSPEQIQEKPHTLSVDIWSLGMVVAEMMKGIVPHHKSRIKAMFLTGAVGITFNKEKKYSAHWSNELFDFLSSCLQMDPAKRPTATQLLQHPFIATAATKAEMLDILPLIFMSKSISKLSVKES
ncbi:putative protein serine/threonine kinase [Tieghemostelium lacteum]|uniref:Protein kinase domain-containing protein n=1 Tax=Tieghemostelium lacteum TaxID=361077 RepID=A0A151Z8I9_TIELA|nr:putative protein serine/threonine kinase [Tieghemostelium lacteum]|eukprot:KYQ90255.1 putative protein serine/threonine kinase [Tieghemostelium lacteum]